MVDHRDLLGRLKVSDAESTAAGDQVSVEQRAKEFGSFPTVRFRPLGSFSDYVCEELGQRNSDVRSGRLSARDLCALSESKFRLVDPRLIDEMLAPASFELQRTRRRTALLDLVWVLRSLDIARAGDVSYPTEKSRSRMFATAQRLADADQRYPTLQWSDIAIHHPAQDPRTFLPPSRARDEEVLMYQVQFGIERIFKEIVESDWETLTIWLLADAIEGLDLALKSLMLYSRVRTVGQFYELDPFLGPNLEYRGHATGAFSAWTYLVGFFLSGNQTFERRLCDELNLKAFDPDARRYVSEVRGSTFLTLRDHIARSRQSPGHSIKNADRMAELARSRFTLFLHSHRGAIKRHAYSSFEDESPSCPPRSNIETIAEAIKDMGMARERV